MGMYDNIQIDQETLGDDPRFVCKKCGARLLDLQTKDLECDLDLYSLKKAKDGKIKLVYVAREGLDKSPRIHKAISGSYVIDGLRSCKCREYTDLRLTFVDSQLTEVEVLEDSY